MSGQYKPSWRAFRDTHEAGEFFHQFSGEDQLKELADDIDQLQQVFEPIHTATVHGSPCEFVIDGISRLDAVEATGRQIVDEKGNWIGMFASSGRRLMVIHHDCRTNDEVWNIVISLNNKRRHYTDRQRAIMADDLAERFARKKSVQKVIDLAAPTEGKGFISQSGIKSKGRPSTGKTEATKKAAKLMNVTPAAVHRARRAKKEPATSKKRKQPEKKVVRSLKQDVREWANKFRRQHKDELAEAETVLVNDLFSHWTGNVAVCDLKSVNLTSNKTVTVRDYFENEGGQPA